MATIIHNERNYDPLFVVTCAIESEYMPATEIRKMALWSTLSSELRLQLEKSGERVGRDASNAVWSALGPWRPTKLYITRLRTRLAARLLLGFLYLGYKRGKFTVYQLLTKAYHVADSHVAGIDGKPFLRLRRDLQSESGCELSSELSHRLEKLFADFSSFTLRAARTYGLEPRVTESGVESSAPA